jgi:hypothetical protein
VRSRTLISALAALAAAATMRPALAADAGGGRAVRAGAYVAAEYGRQQVIGGAQYAGTDMLAADMRTVTSLAFGLRFDASGWVFGGDFGFGETDGDLRRVDPGIPLTIDYRNSSQTHVGLHAGRRLHQDWLVYGYLSEVSRDFEVTLTDGSGTFRQSDGQGILRFGVGVERPFTKLLSWRATLGSARAKFDEPARGEPSREIEVALGIVLAVYGR